MSILTIGETWTAPAWIRTYFDLPWKEDGRDRDGVNCWGLVALIYAERFAIALEHVGTDAAGGQVETITDGERVSGRWLEVDRRRPRFGDVILLRPMGHYHVGLVVEPGIFLHVNRGRPSAAARYDGFGWSARVVSVQRYAGLSDAAVLEALAA